jgi:SCY1-like protein 1
LYIIMNLFKSVVASAISSGIPNFPYSFGDRQDSEAGVWVLQNGQRRVRT